MKQLKKQIRDSFFNPILSFLPALVFMVLDDFLGVDAAWRVSFPVAVGVTLFVFLRYRRMFVWSGLMSVSYVIIGLLTTVFIGDKGLFLFTDEVVFLLLALFFHRRKKWLEDIAPKTLPQELPMSNNVNELYRVMKALAVIVGCYLVAGVVLHFARFGSYETVGHYLRLLYLISIICLGIFESIRVFIIRARLVNEDWLPVVNSEGNVVGSVQYQPGTVPAKRLMHPAVRLYFIKNGKILLQRRPSDDRSEPLLWDAAISRQVRMSESIDGVLETHSRQCYGIDDARYLFLTHYIYHGRFSNQFVYLFVSCSTDRLQPSSESRLQTKWWTPKQIEADLDCEVFTERFELEYRILQRSGLLEAEECRCCPLKDAMRGLPSSEANDEVHR